MLSESYESTYESNYSIFIRVISRPQSHNMLGRYQLVKNILLGDFSLLYNSQI